MAFIDKLLALIDRAQRSFILCLGAGIVCSALLLLGKLDSGAYTAIIMGTVATFVAGETTHRVKSIGQGGEGQ
jgi:hypothetical protein